MVRYSTTKIFLIIYYWVTRYIIANSGFFSANKMKFRKTHPYAIKQIFVPITQCNVNISNVHPKEATKVQKE
jgi:hypothetical protein